MTSLILAQVTIEKRIELERANIFSFYKMYELGSKGFVFVAGEKNKETGQKEFRFDKYNRDLEKLSSKSIVLNTYNITIFYKNETELYLWCFTKKRTYTLVSYNIETEQIQQVDIEVPKKCRVKEMVVLGDYAYLNSTIKNAPYLFAVNRKTGTQKVISVTVDGVNPTTMELNNIQVLKKSNEVLAFLTLYLKRLKTDIYVIHLDNKGNKKKQYKITESNDNNLMGITANFFTNDQYFFTGTYSKKGSVYSLGIFIAQVKAEQISNINFYKFTDLNNFFSYLGDKGQKKIEKKKKKKEAKDKEYNVYYRIIAHDIMAVNNGYILLGEAFRELYKIENNSQRLEFDGYQYTHAFIAKFGYDGELLWSQSFEMNRYYKPWDSLNPKKFISIVEKNKDSFSLVFAYRENIVSKKISSDGKVLQNRKEKIITTNNSDDKLKRTFSSIAHWYDNYFLAYGFQKIKNKGNNNVKHKRKIYFVSKIKY